MKNILRLGALALGIGAIAGLYASEGGNPLYRWHQRKFCKGGTCTAKKAPLPSKKKAPPKKR